MSSHGPGTFCDVQDWGTMTNYQSNEMRTRWFELQERKRAENKKASKIKYQEVKAKKEEKERKVREYRANYKERKKREEEENWY
jgi:hypothetical protein